MIDKNKIEQAAKAFADNLRSITGLDKFDAPFLTAFEHHSDIEESFEAGVEFAKKEMKELAIRFLDSIRDYERESHNLIGFDERSTEELFKIFKEKYYMKEVSLEEILNKKFALKITDDLNVIQRINVLSAMAEACHQAIDLASENATTCTNKESTSIIVNKESVLKTKDQII